MRLVLVAVVGLTMWLSIVLLAIALCRAASRADGVADGTAGTAPAPARPSAAGLQAV